MTQSMLEEQATHRGVGQDDEQQKRSTSGRDSQAVTKSHLKWLNLISSPRRKNNEKR